MVCWAAPPRLKLSGAGFQACLLTANLLTLWNLGAADRFISGFSLENTKIKQMTVHYSLGEALTSLKLTVIAWRVRYSDLPRYPTDQVNIGVYEAENPILQELRSLFYAA